MDRRCAAQHGAVVLVGARSGDSSQASATSARSLVGPEGTITVPSSENPLPLEQLWDPATLPVATVKRMWLDPTSKDCFTVQDVKNCGWITPD